MIDAKVRAATHTPPARSEHACSSHAQRAQCVALPNLPVIGSRAAPLRGTASAPATGLCAGAPARHGRAAARSAIRLISAYTAEIAELEEALAEHFDQHPDAKIVRSLPGLGTVLDARVLGQFGDDRTRLPAPVSQELRRHVT